MIVLIEEKKIPNLKIYVEKESKHVEYCKKKDIDFEGSIQHSMF